MGSETHLRVRGQPHEIVELGAAGPDDELPDAAQIGAAVDVLLAEPFVEVIVPVDDHVGPAIVEQRPQIAQVAVRAVRARREERMVPDRDGAGRRDLHQLRSNEVVLR